MNGSSSDSYSEEEECLFFCNTNKNRKKKKKKNDVCLKDVGLRQRTERTDRSGVSKGRCIIMKHGLREASCVIITHHSLASHKSTTSWSSDAVLENVDRTP